MKRSSTLIVIRSGTAILATQTVAELDEWLAGTELTSFSQSAKAAVRKELLS
jgi:hypothetical protein